LKTDERVIIDAGSFHDTGTILGVASRHIIDCYIVLLDHLIEYEDGNIGKASVFPEGCIERL
jgi:hypothetical protein